MSELKPIRTGAGEDYPYAIGPLSRADDAERWHAVSDIQEIAETGGHLPIQAGATLGEELACEPWSPNDVIESVVGHLPRDDDESRRFTMGGADSTAETGGHVELQYPTALIMRIAGAQAMRLLIETRNYRSGGYGSETEIDEGVNLMTLDHPNGRLEVSLEQTLALRELLAAKENNS